MGIITNVFRAATTALRQEAVDGPFCSFCGRRHQAVKKLIAGPSIYICDRCVNVCSKILRKEAARDRRRALSTQRRTKSAKRASS